MLLDTSSALFWGGLFLGMFSFSPLFQGGRTHPRLLVSLTHTPYPPAQPRIEKVFDSVHNCNVCAASL